MKREIFWIFDFRNDCLVWQRDCWTETMNDTVFLYKKRRKEKMKDIKKRLSTILSVLLSLVSFEFRSRSKCG